MIQNRVMEIKAIENRVAKNLGWPAPEGAPNPPGGMPPEAPQGDGIFPQDEQAP